MKFRILTLLAITAGEMSAQQIPPVRQLNHVVSRMTDSLAQIPDLRPLSGGRVLINDSQNRRILLLDSALRVVRVVLDTSTTAAHRFQTTGSIIAGPGDTTLFFDRASNSLLVIDPAGEIVRVASLPRPADVDLAPDAIGRPVLDGAGNLVKTAMPPPPANRDAASMAAYTAQIAARGLPVIRVSLASRTVDTAGFVRIVPAGGRIANSTDTLADGSPLMKMTVLPFGPQTDRWVVLPDGSVGIVRMSNYHIDWEHPTGMRDSTPKIAHDWRRLSDDDKQHIHDSLQRPYDSSNAVVMASIKKPVPGTRSAVPAVRNVIGVEDFPDYVPPFATGAPLVDKSGNIWIPASPWPVKTDAPIYDVVTPRGVLVDRVQLPGGTMLAGLGDGVAYVTSRTGPRSTGLVTIRIR